ncbi:VOC family protein [Paracidobacterium acidisoli]|uniref:Glyoxalase n=1 Tax=Paracidobacterium acidisoli TaxID=2303751 RepID=A0A372IN52_9BACT|nr:VOC family protein [Paracidobacterium acidisoli]MBT9331970.1 VOC family protein [Paracidobacterium acidisoli]
MRCFPLIFSGLALAALVSGLSAAAQSRPPITGISHIAVYTTDAAGAEQFYMHDLGLKKAPDPENPAGVRYYVDAEQFVEVLPLPSNTTYGNRLDHLGYITTSAKQLRLYLKAHGVDVPNEVTQASDGSFWFDVKDPEGNTVQFVQPPAHPLPVAGTGPIGHRIIHVGMKIQSREKEDTFYRAILGFRPYWYGGMHADKTDWVSQQVPDGHDWLEYMLSMGQAGKDVPLKKAESSWGMVNHFSIGVINMEKAVTVLHADDRLSSEHSGMQLGLDGKWQFNLFDPDETRVELMEYAPVEKPCCSSFTASNPSPVGTP